jgi:uncharacterized membrane protein YbjE (DUF340 family)
MLEVIGFMIIGCVAGWFLKTKRNAIRAAEKLCGWIIFLLLFSLGLSVGKNDAVMENLSNLGLISAGISIAAIVGSIVCAYFLYKYVFKKIKSDE